MHVRYLTHPQVQIDPAIPVPDWGLSEIGRARTRSFAQHAWLAGTARIVSSAERKALETSQIIAAALGIDVEVREAMGENDRSATGYLSADDFEELADRFFAKPHLSIRGWERAVDAQARIVREMEAVLSGDAAGDILCVGHGGVGTLLYCHHAGLAIGRVHDQTAGGGHYFAFAQEGRRVLHGWRPMEG